MTDLDDPALIQATAEGDLEPRSLSPLTVFKVDAELAQVGLSI